MKKSINWQKEPNHDQLHEQIYKLRQVITFKDQQIREHVERQKTLRKTIRTLEAMLSRRRYLGAYKPIKDTDDLFDFGCN